jgi:hypothetical protein
LTSIAFVKFLDAKDKPSGKTYTYLIDNALRPKFASYGISNVADAFHITNESGYNYRGAKVVGVATAEISNEEEYNLSGLKRITSAECCGEIEYPRSERNQDEYEARRDFDRARKKTSKADTATISSASNNKMKSCIKQDGIWQELFKPFELSFTTDNETLNNSFWKILDSAPTTADKVTNVGTSTGKPSGVMPANTLTITTNKTIDGGVTTVEKLDGVTVTNTLTTGANYLKLNNLPKINTEEKKEKTMFEGMLKNLRFGKADNAKMSIYGPALREAITGDTWVAFDKSKEQWIDVPFEAILDIPLFEMPVAKNDIQIGDFIFHAGIGTGWVRVIDFDDEVNYFIEAEDPSNHEIIKILPTRNMFGFDFYTKLIVPFDMGATFGGASASNPFGMLPMLMMMSDKNKSNSNDNSMLMTMMMMQNGTMDFTSNPMMLYALMGDKGSDNSMLMAMLMSQMMQGAPTKHTCDCDHN